MKALGEPNGAPRRGGDLLLPNPAPKAVWLFVRPKPVGDFERAAAAKGDVDDAKASKPVRFVPVGEDERSFADLDDVLDEANAENPRKGVCA